MSVECSSSRPALKSGAHTQLVCHYVVRSLQSAFKGAVSYSNPEQCSRYLLKGQTVTHGTVPANQQPATLFLFLLPLQYRYEALAVILFS